MLDLDAFEEEEAPAAPKVKPILKALRATSGTVCAHAVFVKTPAGWKLDMCAPVLRQVLRGYPMKALPDRLRRHGYTWQWL